MYANLHSLHGDSNPAMSLLFARYVAGQIADPTWREIMNIFDTTDTSAEERIALASFISDAFCDFGADDVKVPMAAEVSDFVTLTRAA